MGGFYEGDLGDLEQVESMQVAEYQLDNVMERYASQVWAGGANEGMADWTTATYNMNNAFSAAEQMFGGWTDRMTGATQNINTQFYDRIGGLQVDDGGYLEATSAALEKMTGNIEEATRLLGKKEKPIRTIGDLHQVYKKDKRKRERAIRSLGDVDMPGKATTISYRDPLTGRRVTHNVGGQTSAEDVMGVRNTNAWADAREWIVNRINAQQEAYHDLVLTEDWIRDNQMSSWQSREVGGQTQYLLSTDPTSGVQNWGTYEERLAQQTSANSATDQWSHIALNEFFGGNNMTLAFFRGNVEGGNEASDYTRAMGSLTANRMYDAFADIVSSTYGNLYQAGFDSIGQSILAAELTGKSVQGAQETIEAQAYKSEEQQKALRKSITQANELFQKSKRKLRKTDKKPKARFGGFRKDTPA